MKDDEIDFGSISADPNVPSIKKLIGEELLERLSAELGGAWLYIPPNPTEHNPIAVVIGLTAAAKLGKAYGGHRFAVPVGPGKRARVRKLLQQGHPVIRISRRCQVSLSFVRKVKSEMQAADQPDLFNTQ